MLGNKIFYLDTKAEKVKEGIIAGVSVNKEGHATYELKLEDNSVIAQFCHLCFENKTEAEARLNEVVALNKEIKTIQDEANAKIDELLYQIHGEPKYVHLTIKGEVKVE